MERIMTPVSVARVLKGISTASLCPSVHCFISRVVLGSILHGGRRRLISRSLFSLSLYILTMALGFGLSKGSGPFVSSIQTNIWLACPSVVNTIQYGLPFYMIVGITFNPRFYGPKGQIFGTSPSSRGLVSTTAMLQVSFVDTILSGRL